ncbi:MFS transporter [Actinoplanes sp. NPDC020271]|uniref:MFS transporter n=1 Tax=Actinoplanes sp. NPDC020271 TaxID=3363896 RepID=UPI0037B1ED2C
MKQLNEQIANFWTDYAAIASLALGLLGVLLLISFGIWAKRSGKPLRPIALSFSMNLALLLNAEGMWVIATEQLHLPRLFAVLVFAVFEICFLTATSLAAEQYRNTTVYGPDGKIETPGHPGPMLWIAALIAGVSGIIVASNAVTGTEKLLRLAVPCVIFLMWWAALTAAGQKVRRGRFAYSPRRLAERWGWLIPDDDPDLERMAAERQMRRMVVNHHRVSSGRWPKSWWRSRLLKDARTAGEPVVGDVVEQLARIQRVMDLLVPGSKPAVAVAVPVAAAPVEAAPVAPAITAAAAPGGAESVIQNGQGRPAQPVQPVQFVPPAAPETPVSPTVAQLAAWVNSTAESPVVNQASLGERLAAAVTPEEMLGMPVPGQQNGSPVAAPQNGAPAPGSQNGAPVAAPRNGVVSGAEVPGPRRSIEDQVPGISGQIPVGGNGAGGRHSTAGNGQPEAAGNGQPRQQVSGNGHPPAVPDGGVPGQNPVPNGGVPGAVPAVLGSIGAVPAPRPFVAPQTNGGNGASPQPSVPSWAATPTGAQRAVTIVGSPWWRLAVERLARLVAAEITPDNLPEMTYNRVAELVKNLAPRVPDLGEGVVRSFVNDYVREMNGEPGDAAFPWRDLLPEPVTVQVGTAQWMQEIEDLRAALVEEMESSDETDPRELAIMLKPNFSRLDDESVREFVNDYVSALGGQPTGSDQPWQHLLPRPQGGRGPRDEEIVEQFGPQLHEHLRTNGKLTRYRVTAVTGVKSPARADRIKAIIEDQAAESTPA